MHALAPELLEYIAFLACADGGPTGCALALVSRRVRAASLAARYFSVALLSPSPNQLPKFVSALKAARADAGADELRARVEQLEAQVRLLQEALAELQGRTG